MKHLLIVLVLCVGFFSQVHAKKKIDLAKYLGDKAAHFERDMDKLLENWNIPFRSWKLKVYPRKKRESNGGGGKCPCSEGGGDEETTESPKGKCGCSGGNGSGGNGGENVQQNGMQPNGMQQFQPSTNEVQRDPRCDMLQCNGCIGREGVCNSNSEAQCQAAFKFGAVWCGSQSQLQGQQGPGMGMPGGMGPGGMKPGMPPKDAAFNPNGYRPGSPQDPAYNRCKFTPQVCMCEHGKPGAASTGAPGAAEPASSAAPSEAEASLSSGFIAASPYESEEDMWHQVDANRRRLEELLSECILEMNSHRRNLEQYGPNMWPREGAVSGGDAHEHLNTASDYLNKAALKVKEYAESLKKQGGSGDSDGDSGSGGCSCDSEKSADNPCGPCGASGPQPQPMQQQLTNPMMQQQQQMNPMMQQQQQQGVPGTPQIWNVQGNNNPAGRNQLQPAAPPEVDPECGNKKKMYCERICSAFAAPNGAGPNAAPASGAPALAAGGAAPAPSEAAAATSAAAGSDAPATSGAPES